MATFVDARAALLVLQSHVLTALTTTYSATFSSYGGADVVLEDDEPTKAMQTGKPFVLLKIERDEEGEFSSGARVRHDAEINVEVHATDFSGGMTGTANGTGSDTLLSQTLASILRADRRTLEGLGLLMPRFTSQREQNEDNSASGTEHINPHRITFVYEKT